MTKFPQQKGRIKNNFYERAKILKEEYKVRENMYSDSLCRMIKDVGRELNRNESEEGMLQAKRKTVELSLVATEQLFKKIADNCSKSVYAERILEQINKVSERKTRKKCEIIAVVNFIRRLLKGVEMSNQMNNFNKRD